MTFDELLTHKTQIMSLFESYGVENPRVFGSTVNGHSNQNSDVDFLVSWPAPHDLIDRIRLKQELEDLLESKVDLVTEKTLYSSIKNQVMQAAIPL